MAEVAAAKQTALQSKSADGGGADSSAAAARDSSAAPELTGSALKTALRFNKSRGYNRSQVKGFQKALGITTDGIVGTETAMAVYAFQLGKPDLDADGMIGTLTRRALHDTTGRTIPKAIPVDEDELKSVPRPKARPWKIPPPIVEAALRYNRGRSFDAATIKEIQTTLKLDVTGVLDKAVIIGVYDFQNMNDLSADGKLGPRTLERMKVDVYADDKDGGGAEDKHTQDTPSGQPSANFAWSEFDCNDGQKVPSKYRSNVRKVAAQLEVLKTAAGGASISLNSGWRSQSWNKKQGGAQKSQHLVGKAADMSVGGKTPKQVANLIVKLIKDGKMAQGGVGRYKTFTHYDVRGSAARWGSN